MSRRARPSFATDRSNSRRRGWPSTCGPTCWRVAGRAGRVSVDRTDVLPVLEYGEGSRPERIARALFHDPLAGGVARATGPTISVVLAAQDARLRRRMALDGRGLAWLPPTPP